jgi:GNAT superfamily N-acetyltransferase
MRVDQPAEAVGAVSWRLRRPLGLQNDPSSHDTWEKGGLEQTGQGGDAEGGHTGDTDGFSRREAAGVARGAPNAKVLEVLFLAINTKGQRGGHATRLVNSLLEKARAEGCEMMYVEVGVMEEAAQCFWRRQGFEECRLCGLGVKGAGDMAVELSLQQLSFFDDYCMRFTDTLQFVKPLR